MHKNINIELLRIISIIMVIFVHIYSKCMLLGLYKSEVVLYVSSFFKICVPCFLMIMGYLYNSNRDLKKLWIKNIYRLIIPLFLFSIFYQWFDEIVIYKMNLNDISLGLDLIKNVFLYNSLWTSGFHLWYIYAIFEIYLLYPIFKVICNEDAKSQKLERYVVILLFIFSIVVPTLEGLFPALSGLFDNFNYGFSYIVFYFLLGHYMKYVIPKLKINKYIFLVFYFVMIGLSILCAQNFELSPDNSYLFLTSFSYQSIFIALAASFFFIFIMKLNIKYDKFLVFLGDKTLMIFYIHLIFVNFIMSRVAKSVLSFVDFILYTFIIVAIVYISSLLFVCLFQGVISFFKKITKKLQM